MTKRLASWVLSLTFCAYGFGADVIWLRLSPDFSYRDITLSCSNKIAGFPTELFFSAEVTNGKVTAARLSRSTSPNTDAITFPTKDLGNTELTMDAAKRVWLKSLQLSSATLNWIFFRAGSNLLSCRPPMALKSIEPAEHKFIFETPDENPDFDSSSELKKFAGQRSDGKIYNVDLRLTQKRVMFF